MADRIPLWYCFGNHMHWVDMEWLWGYHVLPGSTQDMLKFCRETGAKGCVNFDGVGYEKMAAEAPEALTALREAVQAGQVEPSGGSYGQPYGLFHGGESNVRQLIYGARTVKRLLGVWPKTFWEEEFYFFPQLPQMLKQCGFEYASLYFQWTWHTPEVPFEPHPVVWWEGIDGSRLKTATRNKLNLHQWPEDFAHLLSDLAEKGPAEVMGAESDVEPMILQWLELMPSPDWMCRSELMIPSMKALMEDERFEVKSATLAEYLGGVSDDVPVRQYEMHEVWHGMTMGKNGDQHPIASWRLERMLAEAEACAATLSLFGRPYAQWDVYPTWEFEEAWKHLLMGQHHDNHECEGLCGSIGHSHFGHADALVSNVTHRLASRLAGGWPKLPKGTMAQICFWPDASRYSFGFNATNEFDNSKYQEDAATLNREEMSWTLSTKSGRSFNLALPHMVWKTDGQPQVASPSVSKGEFCGAPAFDYGVGQLGAFLGWQAGVIMDIEAVDAKLDPGYGGALRLRFEMPFDPDEIVGDTPYAVHTMKPGRSGSRKYPEGDWMTSPQWFETVKDGLLTHGMLDLRQADGSGIVFLHYAPMQWFINGREVEAVMQAIDPWDEGIEASASVAPLRSIHMRAHDACRNDELWMMARDRGSEVVWVDDETKPQPSPELPLKFQALRSEIQGVVPTAFYREEEGYSSRGLDSYAGEGMGYPFVIRLVEFNGEEAEGTIRVAGQVAKAVKANMLGAPIEELKVTPAQTSEDEICHLNGKASDIHLKVNPREIVTLYLDIEEGRKQARDLDAKREIWATVHRVED